MKHLSAALGVFLAAGCTTRSELGFATLLSEVPATQSAIAPPPGGPGVVAVLQRKYLNGVSQEIALSTASLTAGQNTFYVSLIGDPTSQTDLDDTLKIPPLTPDLIQTEMEERLPGIDMSPSLIFVQNKYGPFGFATGRAASGDLCLYAWQQIEPKETALLFVGGVVSVRLRLCDADATTEQLLRTMYGYTITAHLSSYGWNPYGAPPAPPAHLGQLDAPVLPLSLGDSPGAATVHQRRIRTTAHPVVELRPAPRPLIDKDTVLPSAAAMPGVNASAPAPVPTPPAQSGYPVVPPPPPQ